MIGTSHDVEPDAEFVVMLCVFTSWFSNIINESVLNVQNCLLRFNAISTSVSLNHSDSLKGPYQHPLTLSQLQDKVRFPQTQREGTQRRIPEKDPRERSQRGSASGTARGAEGSGGQQLLSRTSLAIHIMYTRGLGQKRKLLNQCHLLLCTYWI